MPGKKAVETKSSKTSAKKNLETLPNGKNQKKITSTARANLIMPVPKVLRQMRKDRLNARIQRSAAVMMAGLLEYLTVELCDMSCAVAEKKHKKRITNRFIQLAISSDDDFQKLLAKAIIHKGGVVPNIQPQLLKGKKGAEVAEPSCPDN